MILETVQVILDQKANRRLYTVSPASLAASAVKLMCGNDIGAVLVMDGASLEGMFTQRDVLTRIVLPRLDPETTAVSQVMSTRLSCISGATMVDEAMSLMVKRRHRHLPVLANQNVVGMLSAGDLARWILKEQDEQVNSAIRAVRTLAMSGRRGGNG
jgi:CBS domain-containing protein